VKTNNGLSTQWLAMMFFGFLFFFLAVPGEQATPNYLGLGIFD